jgi:spermidine/putrescine transport system ATP-binding protein
MEDKIINLSNITKKIGDSIILNDINLFVNRNEFLTLLGPSGCGKTTTLRIIGGFESPSSGEMLFYGKSMLNIPPHKRNINTVFQKYALFPNLNIFDNIAFGLKIKKLDNKVIFNKVSSVLELVNLKGFEKRSISSLSGGQQQRIAIARALVNEPDVLLLDEPLGALDLKLRKGMQTELKNMQKELGITFIYVTHDQEEALTMSNKIAIMNNGVIQQIGTPEDIYNEPQNSFVATFIGESNIMDGVMLEDYKVKIMGVVFNCVDIGFTKNEVVEVVIRPEDIDIIDCDKGQVVGIVKDITFKGVHYEINVGNSDYTWMIHSTDIAEVGCKVGLSVDPDLIHIMKKV